MLDWLIIGGGVQGTHLSLVLTRGAGVSAHAVRVLDPWDEPLARWRARTANVMMSTLRSPAVHHLDLEPFALKHFARDDGRRWAHFAPPYDRPGLELFDRHCDHVVARHELAALRVRGTATRLSLRCDGVRVDTDRGQLLARRVVLALGADHQPAVPAWAQGVAEITHVFNPGFDTSALPPGHVVVIGGGISAAQLAIGVARRPGCRATLVTRHPLRIHQLDADPGWIGPRNLAGFYRLSDWQARRAAVDGARHRGSVTPQIARRLRRAVARGEIELVVGEVEARSADGALTVVEQPVGERRIIGSDAVVLATGFARRRPGGRLIDDLAADADLPCADCGYPIVDAQLRWHPRVHVAGPLAELEIGPVARNIAGARAIGERLAAAAQS